MGRDEKLGESNMHKVPNEVYYDIFRFVSFFSVSDYKNLAQVSKHFSRMVKSFVIQLKNKKAHQIFDFIVENKLIERPEDLKYLLSCVSPKNYNELGSQVKSHQDAKEYYVYALTSSISSIDCILLKNTHRILTENNMLSDGEGLPIVIIGLFKERCIFLLDFDDNRSVDMSHFYFAKNNIADCKDEKESRSISLTLNKLDDQIKEKINQSSKCFFHLDGANLSYGSFTNIRLSEISMRDAILFRTKICGSFFYRVILLGSNWRLVKLDRALFEEVNFSVVNISFTNLSLAKWKNCSFAPQQIKKLGLEKLNTVEPSPPSQQCCCMF